MTNRSADLFRVIYVLLSLMIISMRHTRIILYDLMIMIVMLVPQYNYVNAHLH